jgi:tRNA (cmo5U34)-methyltransferase
MNEFDQKAVVWDKNPAYHDRAETVARAIIEEIPVSNQMTALEFGAGTGLLSFMLKDKLREIILIDSSAGMVRVMNEKIRETRAANLRAVEFDLTRDEYTGERLDLIYTLMVLHHVDDIEGIIRKFHDLLKPGGYLAIADLYPEDGSFHGEGFTGHKGFDPGRLSRLLEKAGFSGISHVPAYTIEKLTQGNTLKRFELFLMTATRLKKV